MKIKLIDLINAAKPLKRLTELHFNDFSKIYDLVNLKKKVDANLVFYVEEEKKLRDLYTIDGSQFKVGDAPELYRNDLQKLYNTEVDIPQKVTLNSECFLDSSDYPTPEEIILLDPVILWN